MNKNSVSALIGLLMMVFIGVWAGRLALVGGFALLHGIGLTVTLFIAPQRQHIYRFADVGMALLGGALLTTV